MPRFPSRGHESMKWEELEEEIFHFFSPFFSLLVRYGYRFAGLLRILYIGNNHHGETMASFVLNKRWIDGNSNYSLFRKIKRNYISYIQA